MLHVECVFFALRLLDVSLVPVCLARCRMGPVDKIHICKITSLTGLHHLTDIMALVHSPFSFRFLDPFLDFNKLDVWFQQAGSRISDFYKSDVVF